MMAKIPGTGKDLGMYWSCSALFRFFFHLPVYLLISSVLENFSYRILFPRFT